MCTADPPKAAPPPPPPPPVKPMVSPEAIAAGGTTGANRIAGNARKNLRIELNTGATAGANSSGLGIPQ